jgi:hypothetical protein
MTQSTEKCHSFLNGVLIKKHINISIEMDR